MPACSHGFAPGRPKAKALIEVEEALAAFKTAYDIDAGFALPIYKATGVCGIMTKPEEALR